MRPHISIDVGHVPSSVHFYHHVFGRAPEKTTVDYAKFSLIDPPLNLSLVATTGRISRVNHFGIEVESVGDVTAWKARLQELGILDRVEDHVACCFARQDKVWFSDPDGNAWEVFYVHEQLAAQEALAKTGCCAPQKGGLPIASGGGG